MKLPILFIICVLLLDLSCEKDEIQMTPEENKSYTYLALGDSYTIGESVAEEFRWPNQLRDSLVAEGIDMQAPIIIAQTGWRTDNLNNGIDNAGLGDTVFDLVSLLIGVNNQYQGKTVESFEQEYRDLLLRSIDLAGGDKDHVIVLSIPDYGVTPFGLLNKDAIALAIDEFNAAKKRITDSLEVKFFDITPISREAETDKSLIASDSLHPSAEMYKRWVEEVYSDVKSLF